MLQKAGLLVAMLVAGCTGMSERQALSNLPNVAFPASARVASGALTARDVADLPRAGIRLVINLRDADEAPEFDEAAAMREDGIVYRHLPIRGADDLTRMNVERFDAMLREAGDTPTLVHCASGNRVGAMIALRAGLIGHRSIDAAVAEGRAWGLKSLEPAVRERLAAWQAGAGD